MRTTQPIKHPVLNFIYILLIFVLYTSLHGITLLNIQQFLGLNIEHWDDIVPSPLHIFFYIGLPIIGGLIAIAIYVQVKKYSLPIRLLLPLLLASLVVICISLLIYPRYNAKGYQACKIMYELKGLHKGTIQEFIQKNGKADKDYPYSFIYDSYPWKYMYKQDPYKCILLVDKNGNIIGTDFSTIR